MTPKRMLPSATSFQLHQHLHERPTDQSFEDFSCARKRIKMDHSTHEITNMDEEMEFKRSESQQDEYAEYNDLFEQQFYILRAASFKTISKVGNDKISNFNKNQVAQFDVNFQSANGKKKQSFIHMSQEKLRNNEVKCKGRVGNSQKFIGFGSMNEISKFQKKHSQNQHLNQVLQRIRRRQSSFSAIPSGSLNTINTQMINDMMDFNIKDQNEIDQSYLKRMMEMALIKNVKFNTNLTIKYLQRKGEQQVFANIPLHKLLNVDGFSITGFYAEDYKMRINLHSSITNKQFEKKFVHQPQSQSSIEKFKSHSSKDHGVEFKGSLYDRETQQWEEIKFHFSEVKETQHSNKNIFTKDEQNENVNLDNFILIGQQIHSPFGNFIHEKTHRFIVHERE